MMDDGDERKVNVKGERCRKKEEERKHKKKVAEERVNDGDRQRKRQ
jgi:hypothetical protein